jgi:hypothetical protein
MTSDDHGIFGDESMPPKNDSSIDQSGIGLNA